jgi:hypothetical protein
MTIANPFRTYVLVGRTPVAERDWMSWATWMEDHSPIVRQDELEDDTVVSTVFLGFDHGWFHAKQTTPVLFETTVFGGDFDGTARRWTSWEEAEAGHAAILELVRGDDGSAD